MQSGSAVHEICCGESVEEGCCLLQANAEDAVRQMLIEFSERQNLPEVGTVVSEDQMDDGTPIRVRRINLHGETLLVGIKA